MFDESEKAILQKKSHGLDSGIDFFELDRDKFYSYMQHIEQARFWDLNGYSGKDARVGRVVAPIGGRTFPDPTGKYEVYTKVYAETDTGEYLWLWHGKVPAVYTGGFAAGLLRKTAVAASVLGHPVQPGSWLTSLSEVFEEVRFADLWTSLESCIPDKGFVAVDFTGAEHKPTGILLFSREEYLQHRSERHSEYGDRVDRTVPTPQKEEEE